MKKVAAIFFLSLFTLSTTEAGQLLKLPLLVSHYLKHKTEGRSTNFIGFIKEHYNGNQENDSDSKEDRQLPFKAAIQVELQVSYLLPQFVAHNPVLIFINSNYNTYL